MTTFTVTNLDDGGPGSLRQTILNAQSGDTINFATGLAGGTLILTSGELAISKDLTINGDIDGNGSPDITIDAGGISRVFDEGGFGLFLTLDGLVITNGSAASGGGIAVGTADTLILKNSQVTDNQAATTGGGIYGGGGSDISLSNTSVSGNTSGDAGGGIYARTTLSTFNTTISANYSATEGGGIHLYTDASAFLTNTTLAGNKAADKGGAIYGHTSQIRLYDSTLTGNYAGAAGGGIYNLNVFVGIPLVLLSNSIVAGNAAPVSGPDLELDNSPLYLHGNNILGSAPSNASSINTASGSFTTIDGTDQTALEKLFAVVGNNPDTLVLSGVLAKNGGSVQTVAINPIGITYAYNAGSNAAVPVNLSVDARGLTRVVGGTVDIGAFEQQANGSYIVTTLDDEPYDGGTPAQEAADGTGLSLREALSLANAGAGPHTITFAADLAGGTIQLANGELDITSDVTIDGEVGSKGTPAITIDGGYASRVFDVDNGASPISATLDGLIISRGYTGSTSPADNGGGIAVGQSDTLALKNSKVVDNLGYAGGGLYGGQDSTITLTNTSLFGNRSYQAGGAVAVGSNAALTLTNTTVSGNYSENNGGGINLGSNASATLTNATIVGNYSGGNGGGINGGGSNVIKLFNSTLTGNYAYTSGGGIYNAAGGGASLTLANSIVAGNAAYTSGSDLDLDNSPLVLRGKNILGSTPANASVIDQTNGTYAPINGADPASLATVFARVGQNPHTGVYSGVLADNGGPVRTVAIAPGGMADNAGTNGALPSDTFDLNNNGITAEPLPVDARGFARVSGAAVDIGAFEQQPGTNFEVTTLADETYDGGTLAQEMADGTGLSLREALALANQDPTSTDSITFDPTLIGGSTHGVNDGVLLLTNGALTVNGNVTITGDLHGDGTADITIDGQGASEDFAITGGRVTLDALRITGGGGYAYGGGVSLQRGSYAPANVVISRSIITNNQSDYGGGIYVDSSDSLLLTNSVVSGNSALYVGGGIANQGAVEVLDSTVSGNSAGYIGGGIANAGLLFAINSTLSNNQITNSSRSTTLGNGGGGLHNSYYAVLVNTTVTGNNGSYAGGGFYNKGGLLLANATIANNSAGNGGGLYNAACGCGDAALYDTTVTGNYAKQFGGGIDNANGTVTLTNTIVAGNKAGYQGSDVAIGSGTTNYYGVNLFSQTGVGRPGTDLTQLDLTQIFGDLATIDPDGVPNNGDEFPAGTLANNGGPVQTVAIAIGGNAQNNGSTAELPPDFFDLDNNGDFSESLPVDARGAPRVSGSAVDIGAVEAQPMLALVPTTLGYTEQAPPVELSPPFGNPGALTVTEAGASPTQSVIAAAVVTVATGALAGDVLTADTTGTNITASYDSATETLTLTGTDTLADYSQVLDSVTFSSSSDNPDNFGADPTRAITWSVTDIGGAVSAPAPTTTIAITAVNDPPMLSNVAPLVAVTFPGQATTISPALAVGDPDDQNLAGAIVQITGGKFAGDGDVLAATTAGTNISASYDPSSETLTLSGTDTLAHYAQVLDSVTFDPTSVDPTNGGVDKTRTVTWTVNDGHGSNNMSAPAVTTISLQQVVPFDLNGDAVSDLVFQNNGQPGIWLWNGTAPTTEVGLANPGASWRIITSRDLNRDGNADLIWQNSDGTPGIWLMNGTTPIAEVGLANPGANWRVAAAGDVNADGNGDLIWQENGGTLGVWEMNGTTPIAQAGIGNPGANWKVVGAADFNADGRDDILLQDSASGNLMIDLMNGTSIASSVTITVGDPSWHAVSTGEFNGQAEIAWQNNNGTPGLWLMNGTTPAAEVGLPNPGAGWQLVSVDHFTPNGQADLLFQNTNGAMMLSQMNGTSVAATLNLPNPGADWQLVNGHPFAA